MNIEKEKIIKEALTLLNFNNKQYTYLLQKNNITNQDIFDFHKKNKYEDVYKIINIESLSKDEALTFLKIIQEENIDCFKFNKIFQKIQLSHFINNNEENPLLNEYINFTIKKDKDDSYFKTMTEFIFYSVLKNKEYYLKKPNHTLVKIINHFPDEIRGYENFAIKFAELMKNENFYKNINLNLLKLDNIEYRGSIIPTKIVNKIIFNQHLNSLFGELHSNLYNDNSFFNLITKIQKEEITLDSLKDNSLLNDDVISNLKNSSINIETISEKIQNGQFDLFKKLHDCKLINITDLKIKNSQNSFYEETIKELANKIKKNQISQKQLEKNIDLTQELISFGLPTNINNSEEFTTNSNIINSFLDSKIEESKWLSYLREENHMQIFNLFSEKTLFKLKKEISFDNFLKIFNNLTKNPLATQNFLDNKKEIELMNAKDILTTINKLVDENPMYRNEKKQEPLENRTKEKFNSLLRNKK